nr:MAG TPA: hypothetical protein [Caudoviricetes sp.]
MPIEIDIYIVLLKVNVCRFNRVSLFSRTL